MPLVSLDPLSDPSVYQTGSLSMVHEGEPVQMKLLKCHDLLPVYDAYTTPLTLCQYLPTKIDNMIIFILLLKYILYRHRLINVLF